MRNANALMTENLWLEWVQKSVLVYMFTCGMHKIDKTSACSLYVCIINNKGIIRWRWLTLMHKVSWAANDTWQLAQCRLCGKDGVYGIKLCCVKYVLDICTCMLIAMKKIKFYPPSGKQQWLPPPGLLPLLSLLLHTLFSRFFMLFDFNSNFFCS